MASQGRKANVLGFFLGIVSYFSLLFLKRSFLKAWIFSDMCREQTPINLPTTAI